MKKQGWIALYRQLENHWLWEDKPFSKGQAWIDLLLLANHDESKFLLGNDLIELKRGSFVTSEITLMTRWGWGKSKTRAFLELLQKDNMIVKKADHRKTVINIVNYGKFSSFEIENKPPTDRKQTTARPLPDTNNNDNNYNNIYYKGTAEFKAAVEQFIDFRKSIKKPLTKRGLDLLCDKLQSITSDTAEQIEVIRQSIRNGWRDVYPLKKEKTTIKDFGAYDLGKFEEMLNEG